MSILIPPTQLFLGEDPLITFSCATMVEREEWTEAFRVLKLLALPSVETVSSSSPHTGEYVGLVGGYSLRRKTVWLAVLTQWVLGQQKALWSVDLEWPTAWEW